MSDEVRRRTPRRLRRLLSPGRQRAVWSWIAAQASGLRRRRAEKRLTIGVDINSFYEPLTGVGWYLRQILAHLADRPDLRLRLYGDALLAKPDHKAVAIYLAIMAGGSAFMIVVAAGGLLRNLALFPLSKRKGA